MPEKPEAKAVPTRSAIFEMNSLQLSTLIPSFLFVMKNNHIIVRRPDTVNVRDYSQVRFRDKNKGSRKPETLVFTQSMRQDLNLRSRLPARSVLLASRGSSTGRPHPLRPNGAFAPSKGRKYTAVKSTQKKESLAELLFSCRCDKI